MSEDSDIDDVNKLYDELENKFKQFKSGLVNKAHEFIDHALHDWCEAVLSGKAPTREELKSSVSDYIEKQYKELSEKLEKGHP